MFMEPSWKKFLHTVIQKDYEKLISSYYTLRKMFQNSNVENSQLERGEGLDRFMYMERDRIVSLLSKITNDLEKYGLLSDNKNEFINYIQDKFHTIDEETPLKDTNYGNQE